MNKYLKIGMSLCLGTLVGVAIVATGFAKTGTNLGQVYTQSLMSEMTANTAVQNATRYAQRVGEQGMLVFSYDLADDGATGALTLKGCTIPKGAIILNDSHIEVTTALLPSTTVTNAITGGGLTLFAAHSSTLGSAGIKAVADQTTAATSATAPVLTITGTLTSGVFVVYMPYIQGTVWE